MGDTADVCVPYGTAAIDILTTLVSKTFAFQFQIACYLQYMNDGYIEVISWWWVCLFMKKSVCVYVRVYYIEGDRYATAMIWKEYNYVHKKKWVGEFLLG